MELYSILLLGLAVSMDGFFAGMAYGAKKIRIPTLSLVIVSAATLFYTALATFGSYFLAFAIQAKTAADIGASLLILIGGVSIIKQLSISHKMQPAAKKKFFTKNIFLYVIEKPECADIDHSNHLNVMEALLLGTALGIDNMTATFAAGLAAPLPAYTPLSMCIIQTALLYSGICIAQKLISPAYKKKLSYLPGVVLILIGLLRMI